MNYVLDSNIFIQAARTFYAFDIAAPFWEGLLSYAQAEILCSIDKVKDELKTGEDLLSDWVSNEFNDYFKSTIDKDIVQQYGLIVQWAQSQTQYKTTAKNEFMQAEYASQSHFVCKIHKATKSFSFLSSFISSSNLLSS